MSILDEFEDLSDNLEESTDSYFFQKTYLALKRPDFHRRKPNNTEDQIAYDYFNCPFRPGDWMIYCDNTYCGGAIFRLVKVLKITARQTTIMYPHTQQLWSSNEIDISKSKDFGRDYLKKNQRHYIDIDGIIYFKTSVSQGSLIKITDKQQFMKNIIKK